MIDFTNAPQRNKFYAGANGGKLSILYQGELYMLKFPSYATQNPHMHYTHSCISEYIGCKIYKSLGIPVQEVLLGTYTHKSGKTQLAVACKDFTVGGYVLQDFASLKNHFVDSIRHGYGTELSEILEVIEQQSYVDSQILAGRFWDMFITDAFLGNWDRHNGNWGFLYNPVTDQVHLAPVYDCGSCLYPQVEEVDMLGLMSNPSQISDRIYNRPTSAITVEGKRLNYYSFITACENPECNSALLRFEQRVSMNTVDLLIDNTPGISDTHRAFLKMMLRARKTKILDVAYHKLSTMDTTSSFFT